MKTKTLLTLTALTSVLMAGCTNDEPLVTLQKDNHGPIGSSVAKSRTVEDVLDIPVIGSDQNVIYCYYFILIGDGMDFVMGTFYLMFLNQVIL